MIVSQKKHNPDSNYNIKIYVSNHIYKKKYGGGTLQIKILCVIFNSDDF